MFRRACVLGCTLVLLVLTVLPSDTFAAGAPLRGLQIVAPTWQIGTTGECTCDIQWYTVRLNPGTATINANLLTDRIHMGATYSLLLWINHGGMLVGFAKNTCAQTKAICNKHLNVTVKVPKTGVYYLKLKGQGGEQIGYDIRVRGNLSTQRCSRTC